MSLHRAPETGVVTKTRKQTHCSPAIHLMNRQTFSAGVAASVLRIFRRNLTVNDFAVLSRARSRAKHDCSSDVSRDHHWTVPIRDGPAVLFRGRGTPVCCAVNPVRRCARRAAPQRGVVSCPLPVAPALRQCPVRSAHAIVSPGPGHDCARGVFRLQATPENAADPAGANRAVATCRHPKADARFPRRRSNDPVATARRRARSPRHAPCRGAG